MSALPGVGKAEDAYYPWFGFSIQKQVPGVFSWAIETSPCNQLAFSIATTPDLTFSSQNE
jgi:hypothetical protein